jgi:carbamoyl-phosphate synthase large subunit
LLKHIANIDVDCFKVEDIYHILEINCRFGGQYPFCHLAGVDFPKAIINMLSNIKISPELLIAKYGTVGFKDLMPIKIK